MMTSFAHRYRTCCKTATLAVAPATISSKGMKDWNMAQTRNFKQCVRPINFKVFFSKDEHAGHVPKFKSICARGNGSSRYKPVCLLQLQSPKMARGSKKHLTKKEQKALAKNKHVDGVLAAVMAKMGDSDIIQYVDGEPYTSVNGLRTMFNATIDVGEITLQDSLRTLNGIYSKTDTRRTVTPCSFCGKKLGIHLCSGCSKDCNIRYCSQECQKAAWPKHKAVCASRQALDVE